MKRVYRKTPAAQRVDYYYESVTGERFHIRAEEHGAETVHMLHCMDDREVYNALTEGRPKMEGWQRPAMEQWKRQHPGEEPPKNWVLSLDALAGEDGDGMADESRVMKMAADRADGEDPMKELLLECLDGMDADSRRLYALYYTAGYSQAEIAGEFGISQMAVSKRLKKLEAALKDACLKKIRKSL